EPDDEI
ncbi:unnamed protein product, partial [Rotaria sp. Silwood1]